MKKKDDDKLPLQDYDPEPIYLDDTPVKEAPKQPSSPFDDEDEAPKLHARSNENLWYVVHCYSGYENKVKTNLEKRVESMDMVDKIFRVLVPVEEEIEVKNGKKKQVSKKVFPGYVIVEMVMTDDSWYVVRNTPGVTGFEHHLTIPQWGLAVRVMVYRKHVRHESRKNFQLDLFSPDDGYFEYSAITTNKALTPAALAETLCRATKAVEEALKGLRNLKHPKHVLAKCVEINRLENEADAILRRALARMFKEVRDPIEIIKWKEIYENVESAADHCEDVANIIEGVVLDNA